MKRLLAALMGIVLLATLLLTVTNHPLIQAAPLAQFPDLSDSANSVYIGSPSCAVKVTAGDTLGAIAAQYHTTYQQLAAWNGIANPNLISIGECLRVSSSNTVAPTAVVAPTGRVKAAGWRDTYPYGQCTYYAALLAQDDLNGLGNASAWGYNAARRGIPNGTTPRVGAVVLFAPGVQGAGGQGHVAIVTAMLSGGKFAIREMNRSGVRAIDGSWGGPGKIDNWTAWPAAGVSFIY